MRSWLALAYLIGPGFVLCGQLLHDRSSPAPDLGGLKTYAYVNPIIAVVLGWLVLGEEVGVPTVVGGALVVTAVVLVVSGWRATAGTPPA